MWPIVSYRVRQAAVYSYLDVFEYPQREVNPARPSVVRCIVLGAEDEQHEERDTVLLRLRGRVGESAVVSDCTLWVSATYASFSSCVLLMSSILIQYTTQSPFAGLAAVTVWTASSSWKRGGDASTLAAFSLVAILFGKYFASSFDFFNAGESIVGDVLRSLFGMSSLTLEIEMEMEADGRRVHLLPHWRDPAPPSTAT